MDHTFEGMNRIVQTPEPGSYFLRHGGDSLEVFLETNGDLTGRAVFRTEIGGAATARRETVAFHERGETRAENDWRDIPMEETSPGRWHVSVPLEETGVFRGKCCFFPADGSATRWPEGGDVTVKVCSYTARSHNAIYTVFPRQFGSFRAVAAKLDFILGEMGFDIVQTLPPFPVPVTYAVMGTYGCPFAATDFLSVDPAMAEFDERATPLDQFRELIGAVHARGARLFIDLPANHTGWASALQTHHPEWFRHEPDGRFHSPGAWGVVWSDLVELDYAHPELRRYMADVFVHWTRLGVDGFRCDAGYMIPCDTWEYIVARVRTEYPDTVFMLEGLGGKLEVTDALLAHAGLDWAYSELFQTYDRRAFEAYLPEADRRSRTYGTLVHFAETHDNDRLAKGGRTWARLRVALAALLSRCGAWGIANGVEWYATEKIDVHGKNDLNWGAAENMASFIASLNRLVSSHRDFTGDAPLELIESGGGNFLAVKRGGTLILANLDCANGVTAHWNLAAFPPGPCRDALAGDRDTALTDAVDLAPGEVRVFSRTPAGDAHVSSSPARRPSDRPAVAWRYPEDTRRTVPVPNGLPLRVTSARPFRVRVQDGERTVVVRRGVRTEGGAYEALLPLPPYAGDGTSADRRQLVFTDYAPDGVRRTASRLALLPPAEVARVKVFHSGAEIRRNARDVARGIAPDGLLETVLSDGAGSASRVKLAWGEIRSQYDAIFAANPNPDVPADRLVLWTRCRAWLHHEGYIRAINADCLEGVATDPAGRFAEWLFSVPCGTGRTVRLAFRLALERVGDVPTARLAVRRLATSESEDAGPITLVMRPDLEWRSFHATTKAQGDVERAFAGAATAPDARTVRFAPYGDEALVLSATGGAFHLEGEWSYCVSHAEEAARGQEGSGDLYAPAWLSFPLAVGGEETLSAAYVSAARCRAFDAAFSKRTGDAPARDAAPAATRPLVDALCEAMKLFIVKRDDVKTVLAGYPWFLDWGRDTFIFLQGAIAAGFRAEALAIVEAFARFEENGTLPNIIYGTTAGNRDTTDAPLWFIRTLAVLGPDGERFRPVAESIVAHYIAGTPNGIRVDPESALAWSPSHFTWMDTNYPACTPRCGYPVEIEALWIAALDYVGDRPRAERARASLARLFATPGGWLADCLDAPSGEPAAQARRDDSLRPNQLFALTLGAVTDPAVARPILDACARLLVPGGIRTLDAADPKYRGTYAGDEDTQRKPAYHNGTAWAWPMPLYAEAAFRTGLFTRAEAASLVAGVVENLNAGCVCHVSEIADGDAPHAQKGCRAQAWSVSECLRVLLALSARREA